MMKHKPRRNRPSNKLKSKNANFLTFAGDISELKSEIVELKKTMNSMRIFFESRSSTKGDAMLSDYFKMLEDVDIPEVNRSESSSLIRFDLKKKSPF